MQYHLSRNNIVTGPYSKEELIKHGILPTDLIKEESSEQWRAADKFEDFKNIATTAKPKYKITADKEVVEVKNEDVKKSEAAAEMPANSPFKRVPSAISKKKTAEENTDTKEKPEIKKEVPRNIPKPIVNTEQVQKTEKADYIPKTKVPLTRPQQKGNSTNVVKEIFAPLLILAAIGFVSWFAYKKFFSVSSTKDSPVVQALPADSMAKQSNADTVVHKSESGTKKHIVDSSAYYARRDSIRRASQARRDSLALLAAANKKDSAQQAAKKNIPESSTVKKDITPVVADTKKQPATTATVNTPPNPPEKKPAQKKSKSIGDYVSVSVNKIPDKEVKGIKLNIKNVSDQALNIAIIDVSYTDADGKIIRGETLQAENIGAGKTSSIRVPNEKKAANISYKVSLISGDNVYLMGK